MVRRIAIKKMSASDLTFFAHHYDIGRTHQKCINLNVRPFIKEFYPGLEKAPGSYNVTLNILGPGLHPRKTLARKVNKSGSSKNWRLNGEFVHDDDLPPAKRVHGLVAEDLSIIEFHGDLKPETVDLYLLQESDSNDVALVAGLKKIIGNKSMASVSVTQVLAVLEASGASEKHPLYGIGVEGDDVECEVATPGEPYKPYVVGSRTGQTQEQLDKAAKNRTEVGNRGEKWFEKRCAKWKGSGAIKGYKWVADNDKTAPFDFELVMADDSVVRVDVKATDGAFSSAFFVSGKELEEMAKAGIPHRICRLGGLSSPEGPECKFTQDLQDYASTLWTALDGALPADVGVKNLSWKPKGLAWDDSFGLD